MDLGKKLQPAPLLRSPWPGVRYQPEGLRVYPQRHICFANVTWMDTFNSVAPEGKGNTSYCPENAVMAQIYGDNSWLLKALQEHLKGQVLPFQALQPYSPSSRPAHTFKTDKQSKGDASFVTS